jgi:hypothetical protein
MTDHVGRLYALVAGVVVFLVAWAAVAAHPWAPRPAQDPRLAALAARQQQVRVESLRVKQIVDRRWAVYRHALAARNAAAAKINARNAASAQLAAVQSAQPTQSAQPAVQVVNLPPLVITRTS